MLPRERLTLTLTRSLKMSATPDARNTPDDLVTRAALRHTNVFTLRKELNLTKKELARHARVSIQTVMRAEQGLHPHLSGRIANALSELANVDSAIIRQRYRSCRAHNITEFSSDITSQDNYQLALNSAVRLAATSDGSPIQSFREQLFGDYGLPTSGIKFCIMTGLHSAVLNNVESGRVTWSECKALHRTLRDVLHIPEVLITGLGKLHDEYYLMSHHD